MLKIDKAMSSEDKVKRYYIDLFKKVDCNCLVINEGKFSVMDLVIKDSISGNYHLLEIKQRFGIYTLEYITQSNGIWVEKYKLDEVKRKYNKDNFTLIVITSDNYIIKTVINDNCDYKKRATRKTTCSAYYNDYTYVEKEYLVTHNYEYVCKLEDIK